MQQGFTGQGEDGDRSRMQTDSKTDARAVDPAAGEQAAIPYTGRPQKWFVAWLALMTVLAFGTRFVALERSSLLLDELFSVRDAALLVQQPIDTARDRVKVFGYLPVALGLWIHGVDLRTLPAESPDQWREAGVRAFGMRLGPALVGIITVPLLGWLSVRLIGTRAAALLTLLLALAPWHIYWSQASRFYITQFLLYNLALLLYYYGTRESNRRRSLWYLGGAMIGLVFAFVTQFTSGVFLFVIAADWLICRMRGERWPMNWKGYLILVAGASVCTGLLVVRLIMGESWADKFGPEEASPIGFTARVVYFIGPIVIVAAGMGCLSRSGVLTGLRNFLVIAAVMPIIVFAALSFRDFAGSRYAFMCLFPWLVLAAIGLNTVYEHLHARIGKIAACMPLAMVLVAMIIENVSYYVYNPGYRPHWKEAMALVERDRQPGEHIYSDRIWVTQYYLGEAAVDPVPRRGEPKQFELPAWFIVSANDPKQNQSNRLTPNARLESSYITVAMKPLHCVYVFSDRPQQQPDGP